MTNDKLSDVLKKQSDVIFKKPKKHPDDVVPDNWYDYLSLEPPYEYNGSDGDDGLWG